MNMLLDFLLWNIGSYKNVISFQQQEKRSVHWAVREFQAKGKFSLFIIISIIISISSYNISVKCFHWVNM